MLLREKSTLSKRGKCIISEAHYQLNFRIIHDRMPDANTRRRRPNPSGFPSTLHVETCCNTPRTYTLMRLSTFHFLSANNRVRTRNNSRDDRSENTKTLPPKSTHVNTDICSASNNERPIRRWRNRHLTAMFYKA